jgi:GT2 family glycosyltransferase
MMSPELSVILPAWNRPELVASCLSSLESAVRRESVEVIIVDNGSDPPLPVMERSGFSYGCRQIRTPRNLGFAAAANRGAACARGRSLLFLTSDVQIPENTVVRMLAALRADPGLGAIAPLELDSAGRVRCSGMRFLTPFNHALGLLGVRVHHRGAIKGRGLDPDYAQWIPAAALLSPAKLFRAIGGFDEKYFFYEEDEDLCWRLQRRGYRVAVCARATITHPGKGSASLAGHRATMSLYQGQLMFLTRRLGGLAALAYRLATSAVLLAKWFAVSSRPSANERDALPAAGVLPSILSALWMRHTIEMDTKAA